MPPRLSGLAAAALLTGMFLVMLGSSWQDALTMDEPLHITAGYTYLRFRDARLNPQHPPSSSCSRPSRSCHCRSPSPSRTPPG
jgi:hypothetical protein